MLFFQTFFKIVLSVATIQALPIVNRCDNGNLTLSASLQPRVTNPMSSGISDATYTVSIDDATPVKLTSTSSKNVNSLKGLKKVFGSLSKEALRNVSTLLPWSSEARCRDWQLPVEVCQYMSMLRAGKLST